jgi:hypothetical protein
LENGGFQPLDLAISICAPHQFLLIVTGSLNQILVIIPKARVSPLDILSQTRGDLNIRSQFRLEAVNLQFLVVADDLQ